MQRSGQPACNESRYRGATRRELLLALLAVGSLAAVGVPWVQSAREASRASTCRDHLAALLGGLRAYHESHQRLPPAAEWSTTATASLSLHLSRQLDAITHGNWALRVLPHTPDAAIAQQWSSHLPLAADANAELRLTQLDRMSCPSDVNNHADNSYELPTSLADRPMPRFARGNYAINGGTHNYQHEPPSTSCSRGDVVQLLISEEPRRFEMVGNGIAGINRGFALEEFRNGASSLIALEELRAGLTPLDPRGVWAWGQIGGSITWGHGVSSDAFGPNHRWPRSDDVRGCGELHALLGPAAIAAAGMPCVDYVDNNQQATSRSLHPGGVHVALLDGAVRFLHDGIDPGLWHVLHSRETPPDRLADWTIPVAATPAQIPSLTRAATGVEDAATALAPFRNSVGMQLTPISAGEFEMGVPDVGNGRDPPSECPQHHVRLTRPFWLAAHETTRAQYRQVMGRDPQAVRTEAADAAADEFPVTHVTWDEASEFCRKLSALEPGHRYRLPTEAEWEYCCRCGSDVPYDWSAKRRRRRDDATGEAAGIDPPLPLQAVGRYPANAWGLHDLRGNAWEWTFDWFARNSYARSPIEDPSGPVAGYIKVVRGGDWRFIGENCRIDYPMQPPWKANPLVGFRVACEVE